ncbi:MAG: hypothetical protein COB07_03685 [Sulfurovum sp.]|nr:MAG: hypothetical protein COB07_03685 [Sulfurovum sp.]
MKSETQAFHLAKMMQDHTLYPKYELTLPLVAVRSKKMEDLFPDDVLLLGLNVLEFVLMDSESICANVVLKDRENIHELEIIHLEEDVVKTIDSKKYKILKISFGTVQSKVLEEGETIDITHIALEKVTLWSENKKLAEGSLINVDNEIAIKIDKVIK